MVVVDVERRGGLPDPRTKGGPERLAEPESRRSVKAVGLLLLLQVAGLAALGLYEFTWIDWHSIDPGNVRLSGQLAEVVAYGLFAPPAVLMVLAALGFLFMRRRGWLMAAIAQGLCLGASIQLYTVYEPYYVYPVMVYCVLMILYLNSQSVRVVFRRERLAPQRRQEVERDV